MNRRFAAILTVLVLLAAACGDDATTATSGETGGSTTTSSTTTSTTTPDRPDTPEGRLAAARALWADNGPASYRLTTQQLCFCPETVWIDTVVDGQVVAHEPASRDAMFDPGEHTMETLFDEVEAVIDEGYATLELDFDPETGGLRRYWADISEMMADEEHGVEVVSLEPDDGEVSAGGIDAALLTDDYGCGYGFAKGDPDQSLALVIQSSVGYQPDGASLSFPVTFPSPDWTAEVRVGADLFSNWCDDVIEPSEPEPIVAELFTLVAGTLTLDTAVPDTGCGGVAVRGSLVGAVAESPTGEQVELDDVALTNDGWGCFAG
jgi:hypothetical protein